jgi:hypothetical protein
MEPTSLIAASGAVLIVSVTCAWALGRGRRTKDSLEVVFVLGLPSKWAAELTAQTLENEGISSRVSQAGSSWRCIVRKPMGGDRSQIEPTCRKLDQIARARGGGCIAHRMKLGNRQQVFEH